MKGWVDVDSYHVLVRFTVKAGSEQASIDQVTDWLRQLRAGKAVAMPAGVSGMFEVAEQAINISNHGVAQPL